jgi:hypothetical protein
MIKNLGRNREDEFHLDETMYTLFKKIKSHKISIGVNKFYFNT